MERILLSILTLGLTAIPILGLQSEVKAETTGYNAGGAPCAPGSTIGPYGSKFLYKQGPICFYEKNSGPINSNPYTPNPYISQPLSPFDRELLKPSSSQINTNLQNPYNSSSGSTSSSGLTTKAPLKTVAL